MKILTILFAPLDIITSANIRFKALIRGLLDLNNQVDVLCLNYSKAYTESETESFMNEANLIILKNNNVAYDKLILSENKSTIIKLLRKFTRYLYHLFAIYDHNKNFATSLSLDSLPSKEYDIVITSSEPLVSHLVIPNLKKQGLKYKKLIQYWGDPLTQDITRRNHLPSFVLKKEEKKILNYADKIVYVSPFTLESQKKLFPNFSNKMFFYPVPYMKEEIFPQTSNKKFIIGYYGNYQTNARNILPFYHAVSSLDSEFETDIYGHSDLILNEKKNVHFHKTSIVNSHKSICDLLICILNSTGCQIPGKIYHYSGTNKKILIILDGENQDRIYNYLKPFNRFYFCKNNEKDIRKSILEIRNIKTDFQPCQDFRWNYIAEKIIS